MNSNADIKRRLFHGSALHIMPVPIKGRSYISPGILARELNGHSQLGLGLSETKSVVSYCTTTTAVFSNTS